MGTPKVYQEKGEGLQLNHGLTCHSHNILENAIGDLILRTA